MYAQFALVIAATALLSAINAATLKPTQAALWMRVPVPPERRNFFYRFFNRGYDALERGYVRLINRMASASAISVVISLLVVAAGLYGLSRVASGFIPIEDQGYLVVAVQLPDGASLERTQKAMDQVGAIARRTPGVDQFVTVAGISPLDNSASLANAAVDKTQGTNLAYIDTLAMALNRAGKTGEAIALLQRAIPRVPLAETATRQSMIRHLTTYSGGRATIPAFSTTLPATGPALGPPTQPATTRSIN